MMGMNATSDDNSQWMELIVTFDPPVINLTFRLGDVDLSGPNWLDLLLVEALEDDGDFVTPTSVTFGDGSGTNTVTNSTGCPGYSAGDNRCFVGTFGNNSPNSNGNGNANLTYGGGNIASVRIRYFASFVSGGSNPAGQWVAIGAMSWTDTLPVELSQVTSEVVGDTTVVRWTTASETLNAGFRVLAQRGGVWSETEVVPSVGGFSGLPQRYEVTIPYRADALALEDIDMLGRSRGHGPFVPGVRYGEEAVASIVDWPAVRSRVDLVTPLERVAAAQRVAAADAAVSRRSGVSRSPGLASSSRIGSSAKTGSSAKVDSRARIGSLSEVVTARLLVAEAGIQRVSHESLLAAGVDLTGFNAENIDVRDGGVSVPRFVGGAETFGPGSWIEFLARPQLTLWSPVDVFELRAGAGLVGVSPVVGPSPHGDRGRPQPYVQSATFEHRINRVYSPASPTGDPWYDGGVNGKPNNPPSTLSRSFDLPGLATGEASLRLHLWGGNDYPGSTPDHHVQVRLNGTLLGDSWFDGVIEQVLEFPVTGLLLASANLFELTAPGDTTYPFDFVNFEGFEIVHQRDSLAVEGRFEGKGRPGGYQVSGWGAGPVTGWTARKLSFGRENLVRYDLDVGDAATVRAPSTTVATSLWLAEPSAMSIPGVEPGIPDPAPPSPAQYLIVSHPAFAAHLGDWVALQTSRGYSVDVATTDRIYAAYSDHQEDPLAISRFLEASHNTYGNLRFVLLVGTTTSDPYDYGGSGSVSFVPTLFVPIDVMAFSPSDDVLVDFDGDGVPNVALGRLPVRTPEDLAVLSAKSWSWAPEPTALLSSGLSTLPGSLPAINATYEASLDGWTTSVADVDTLGRQPVRDTVLAAFGAEGPSLVSFVGHGSYGLWDFQYVLRWSDVATLGNVGRPVVALQWGCWNAYFVSPDIDVMSSHLLLTPDVGAVVAIGATTLTSEASHQALGSAFFAAIDGGAPTVGDAWLSAKAGLALSAAPRDALWGMALLGDPATPLPAGASALRWTPPAVAPIGDASWTLAVQDEAADAMVD
jgi:hypothetical protein